MADFTLRWDGGGNHIRFEEAVALLGSERQARAAFRRAINHTGDRARTIVTRTLAKQMGLPVRRLRALGQPSISRAGNDRLEYVIRGSGRPLPLREFSAKQFSFGVRAKPWGRSQRFAGAFIFAGTFRSGKFVGGGHVFKRTSGDSLPIEKLYGPSVPTEMTKDATAEAFMDVALDLGPRISHEVRRMTDGVVT